MYTFDGMPSYVVCMGAKTTEHGLATFSTVDDAQARVHCEVGSVLLPQGRLVYARPCQPIDKIMHVSNLFSAGGRRWIAVPELIIVCHHHTVDAVQCLGFKPTMGQRLGFVVACDAAVSLDTDWAFTI